MNCISDFDPSGLLSVDNITTPTSLDSNLVGPRPSSFTLVCGEPLEKLSPRLIGSVGKKTAPLKSADSRYRQAGA
jgi:hypothetical protein